MSVIIFETFCHTQDEYIQLLRLIDLLTWAPSCLVYSNCHNSALNSSSSISVQTPLGALLYGSAWVVWIKNNWTKIKWNCVKKRVYTVLVKNSWNHISGVWCCPILDGMTPRMTVPLFELVDCSRFWWCLERKTSGILKFLRTVSCICIWDHACVFPHVSTMPTFQLNLKVGILLISEKHLHGRIISLESRFGHMKLVYNWSVCTKTGKWCHICVIGSILP